MSQKPKNPPTNYQTYLRVPDLLTLQDGLSHNPSQPLPPPEQEQVSPEDFLGNEERLFITVHQVFELWFKIALGELEAFHRTLGPPNEGRAVAEDRVQWLVKRLRRVKEIFKQGIGHFELVETLTPIDFLAFRDKLVPASGFQSVQMRKMEVLLGYPLEGRKILREGKQVRSFINRAQDRMELDRIEEVVRRQGDIRTSVMAWLARTPIDFTSEMWRKANADRLEPWDDAQMDPDKARALAADAWLKAMLDAARGHSARMEERTEESRKALVKRMNAAHLAARQRYLAGLESQGEFDHFSAQDGAEIHDAQGLDGESLKTLWDAETVRQNRQIRAALLFIQTHPQVPLLSWPNQLIEELLAVEQHLLLWRNRHARMVELVIGRRPGTGGSEGVGYLDKTSQHRIFNEIWLSRTYLLDRHILKRQLADGQEIPYIRDADGFYSDLGGA